MKNKKTKSMLELSQERAQNANNKVNECINELGVHTNGLYIALTDIQELFDEIRNIPSEEKLQYEKLKQIRLNWVQQTEKISRDFKNAVAKDMGTGAIGVSLGVAVAAAGPTVAMGVATTFGVASTGTAISTLSGAAATKAAIAWLGGGALSVGGGGIAAGNTLLALTGPVGLSIAFASIATSGLLLWKNSANKKRAEAIYASMCDIEFKRYNLAIVELNERVNSIIDETEKIDSAIKNLKAFGLDYNKMTEAQQYELGSYVNLMLASTQLLVNPIKGLQPKYNEEDFEKFIASITKKRKQKNYNKHKSIIIALANILYKVELNNTDKKIFCKSLKRNNELLESLNVTKNDLSTEVIDAVIEALSYKYA